jgi:hypothetical protein
MSCPQSKDLLNIPSQWPVSVPAPVKGTSTRVLTYLFDPKDTAKVEVLLNLINTKFPNAKVAVVKDSNGFTSVSITQGAVTSSKSGQSAQAAWCEGSFCDW